MSAVDYPPGQRAIKAKKQMYSQCKQNKHCVVMPKVSAQKVSWFEGIVEVARLPSVKRHENEDHLYLVPCRQK